MKETEQNVKISKKESDNMSCSTRNLKKFKDLSLNESYLKNKHFFTPKTSEDDNKYIKTAPDIVKNSKRILEKKQDASPLSTAIPNENNDKKFQNGFQNKFFNPMNFESPDNHSATPTKVEFGNIFTEEELSDVSGDLENFEKKFPQEIIEKYDRKSKKTFK